MDPGKLLHTSTPLKENDMRQKTQQLPGQTERVARGLRPYRSPTLSMYGAIRDLTAEGSGIDTENMGKDFQPDKRP